MPPVSATSRDTSRVQPTATPSSFSQSSPPYVLPTIVSSIPVVLLLSAGSLLYLKHRLKRARVAMCASCLSVGISGDIYSRNRKVYTSLSLHLTDQAQISRLSKSLTVWHYQARRSTPSSLNVQPPLVKLSQRNIGLLAMNLKNERHNWMDAPRAGVN
ncbi:hypothetical protein BC835DRAFT_945163 [Cytidiella melzeri]|nr:hypothetical protein BC835DRAFT_945163 [Cytidiella melzeri]